MVRWRFAWGIVAVVIVAAAALAQDKRPGAKQTPPPRREEAREPAGKPAAESGKHYEAGLVEESVEEVKPAKGDGKGRGVQRKITGVLKIKGRKRRLDLPPWMTTIYNGETGVTIFLTHEPEKTYRRLTAEQLKESAAAARREGITLGPPPGKPTPTGKTRRIDGHTAHAYRRNDGAGRTETMWVVKDFPHYDEIARLKAESTDGPPSVELPPGFIIQWERQSKDGGTRVTTHTIRAEPVDDSEFAVPTGYKQEPEPGAE